MNEVKSSEVIDNLLRFAVAGGVLTVAVLAPNAITMLDKPTRAYFKKLDERSKQREFKRLLYYMKQRDYIKPRAGGYDHGIIITKKGREYLSRTDLEQLSISRPKQWDKQWRIVFFDIPERYKAGRKQLAYKLKQIGFYQLQRSVWVHPFPCRPEIEFITATYEVQKYVSYIEAGTIDSEHLLIERFKQII